MVDFCRFAGELNKMSGLQINELTRIIIGIACKIHSRIGAACFEKVYEEILYHELIKLGYKVERQILLPIVYDDLYIKDAYKIDLLVEDCLIVELKSVFPLPAVYFKQVRKFFISFPSFDLLAKKKLAKRAIIKIISLNPSPIFPALDSIHRHLTHSIILSQLANSDIAFFTLEDVLDLFDIGSR